MSGNLFNDPRPYLFFIFFQFHSVVHRESKVYNFVSSLFFGDAYYKMWSSGKDLMICLYLGILSFSFVSPEFRNNLFLRSVTSFTFVI